MNHNCSFFFFFFFFFYNFLTGSKACLSKYMYITSLSEFQIGKRLFFPPELASDNDPGTVKYEQRTPHG